MKKSLTGLLAAVFLLLSLTSCGDNRSYTAADGLDLHAVASLIYKAHDGEHFEALLNQPGINNLDLDGDGWKDDIDVTERSQGLFRGYSLTVTMPDQSIQEVADIRFEHNMFTGHLTFEILGNTEIYGANRFVRSVQPLTFGQVIFVGWVFAPRPLYVSPYGRVHLSPTYVRVRTVPVTTYRTVATTIIKTSGIQLQETKKAAIVPAVQSPNAGKSSATIVAPLAQPTKTQKQFQERPETRQIQQATGFAKPKTKEEKTIVPEVPKKETPPAVLPAVPLTEKKQTDKALTERDPARAIPPATGFGKGVAPVTPTPPTPVAPAPAIRAPVVPPPPAPRTVAPPAPRTPPPPPASKSGKK